MNAIGSIEIAGEFLLTQSFSKLNNQAKSNKIIPRNNKTLVYLIFHPE
jgi:hypothetical protein